MKTIHDVHRPTHADRQELNKEDSRLVHGDFTTHVRGYLQICRKCKKYKRLQHPVFPGGHPSKY